MATQNLFTGLFGMFWREGSVDATEALPLPDVEYIGIGDEVVYERSNEYGEVVMLARGTVVKINYVTQQVQLFVKPALRLWVDVSAVSLVSTKATAEIFAEAPISAI